MSARTQETPSVRRKPNTSDLSDEQWAVVGPMLVLPEGGRPRTTDMRETFNGIFYQLRTGCAWKDLPRAPSNEKLPPEAFIDVYTANGGKLSLFPVKRETFPTRFEYNKPF